VLDLVTSEGTLGGQQPFDMDKLPVLNELALKHLFNEPTLAPSTWAIEVHPQGRQSLIESWLRASHVRYAICPVAYEYASVRETRVIGLRDYLDMCLSSGAIAPNVGAMAWSIWRRIDSEAEGKLEVPDACPGPSGNMLLTWDRGRYHFEIEIESDLTIALFYLDRTVGQSWELPTRLNEPFDERVKGILKVFKVTSAMP
jgi:hypothetical protein